MRRLLLLICLLIATTALSIPAAKAEKIRLSGSEIVWLLAGNTIFGRWDDVPARLYFEKGGTARYQLQGQAAYPGIWIAQDRRLCATWPTTEERCFALYRNGDVLIWVDVQTNRRYHTQIAEGDLGEW